MARDGHGVIKELDRSDRHGVMGPEPETRWLDSITDSMAMNLRKLWEIVEDRGAWCAVVRRVTKSQT